MIPAGDQPRSLGRARQERQAYGEIETEHPGYLGAHDTSYAGALRGAGRIYQQTFVDTYTRVAVRELYDRERALCAADTLNDRVLPFFEAEGVPLPRVLADRGPSYRGSLGRRGYEPYLAPESGDRSKTKVKSPRANGICGRFHKSAPNESYRVASGKMPYSSPDELQADLGARLKILRLGGPHPGRHCCGRTPVQTRRDAKPLVGGKMPGRQHQPVAVHYDGQPAAA